MAVRTAEVLFGILPEVRVHPVSQRIRAAVDDIVVVDSRDALIVWEPRRVVGSYAVRVEDIAGTLVPYVEPSGGTHAEHGVRMGASGPRVLDPRTAFTVHTCPGSALTIRTAAGDLAGAAFAPDDPDLDGYVVLDWAAFTAWLEEDQVVMGHPHDPFDRIDCLASSRHVVISVAGHTLADTHAPVVLLETPLPMRFYIPRADVRMELLTPTDQRSVCAYKGVASYWSATVEGKQYPDIVWSYEHPLHDALPVKEMMCFFTERLDIEIDGVPWRRPVTPWS